ncbi:MAG: FAD-binding protein [Gammaproteobacteria bacterium]|nr:FAD-binding protein [Gammaproteobacteria bacterium]
MKPFTRRSWLSASAIAALISSVPSAFARGGVASGSTPWRNWSGGVVANPEGRFSPASEDELASYFSKTSGVLRPVGSGHSFSPLVPTDGHLVVIDQLTGLLDHDKQALKATFAAGTRLGDMGPILESHGQAMYNLPDIDRQTLAGATATATHGTGIDFGCLSSYVTALRMVTPAGEVLDIDADSNPELFAAACVSLGSLGVVTRMTIQNRTPYRLLQNSWVAKTEDLLEDFDNIAAKYRHFEIFPFTHSDYSSALSTQHTDEAIDNPSPSVEEEAGFAQMITQLSQVPPRDRLQMVNAIMSQTPPSQRVDTSYRILANVRNTRFNEMEYSVPIEAGADCLREVLRTIIEKEIDVVFPLEYRYVRRDDTWLSMSSGHEDHAAISIHRAAQFAHNPYFDLIEPIFWKYGGRPHWGKVHSLDARALTKLYPHFRDFQEIRASLDPTGRMLNPHLSKVFGVRT